MPKSINMKLNKQNFDFEKKEAILKFNNETGDIKFELTVKADIDEGKEFLDEMKLDEANKNVLVTLKASPGVQKTLD